jgi:hypothetical protein
MAEGEERRRHPRLPIRLPVELVGGEGDRRLVYRTVTRDVSSSGLSFDADAVEFAVGTPLEFQLQVPPGEGYFPSAGRVRGCGQVVRVDCLPQSGPHPRYAIAASFAGPLKAVF